MEKSPADVKDQQRALIDFGIIQDFFKDRGYHLEFMNINLLWMENGVFLQMMKPQQISMEMLIIFLTQETIKKRERMLYKILQITF